MNSDWLAAQLIGWLFYAGAAYVIDDWRTLCGIVLLYMAWGITHSVQRNGAAGRADPDDKNWVEE